MSHAWCWPQELGHPEMLIPIPFTASRLPLRSWSRAQKLDYFHQGGMCLVRLPRVPMGLGDRHQGSAQHRHIADGSVVLDRPAAVFERSDRILRGSELCCQPEMQRRRVVIIEVIRTVERHAVAAECLPVRTESGSLLRGDRRMGEHGDRVVRLVGVVGESRGIGARLRCQMRQHRRVERRTPHRGDRCLDSQSSELVSEPHTASGR
jgi:hypothetical protein